MDAKGTEHKRQIMIQIKSNTNHDEYVGEIARLKDDTHRTIIYESDWVLTDFWLPVAVVFSLTAFLISIYVGFFN